MAASPPSTSLPLPRRRENHAPERAPQPSYAGLLEVVAVAANQAAAFEQALAFALARICECTPWTAGRVWLTAAAPAPARLQASGLRHGSAPTDSDPSRLAQRAWSKGRAVWAGQGLALPVRAAGEVAAVLDFFTDQEEAPAAGLLRVLNQVAEQLGQVAERQWRQQRLLHDSSHDPLTGLPNRNLFLDRLDRALARGRRRSDARLAVLLVDLDRFHVLNDSLGNIAGDQLLRAVSERFAHTLRSSDLLARTSDPEARECGNLARLGGDEFTVLLEDLPSDADALRVAERLQACLTAPLSLGGREVFACASIGIACGGSHTDAGQLLRDADLAMGRAKALGGNRTEIYDQTLHAAALARMGLETDLRTALARDQFVLHYQPIVDVASGAVQGVEALLRWRRDTGELVYPADFIPIAEDTGLILPLGLWVLRQACATAHAWQREFSACRHMGISINLSPRQFSQPDLAAEIRRIIEDTGIDPSTVRLEITETALAPGGEGLAPALAMFTQLKALGVHIGLDDFGTGYSSLSYLHRFPLDLVKIDRSFVAQLGGECDSRAIVKTIMDLAHNLNLQIIAEGAETAAHVAQLRSLGCQWAQGYYFARPMDAEHLRALLASAA